MTRWLRSSREGPRKPLIVRVSPRAPYMGGWVGGWVGGWMGGWKERERWVGGWVGGWTYHCNGEIGETHVGDGSGEEVGVGGLFVGGWVGGWVCLGGLGGLVWVGGWVYGRCEYRWVGLL